jgi:hypothetical protein
VTEDVSHALVVESGEGLEECPETGLVGSIMVDAVGSSSIESMRCIKGDSLEVVKWWREVRRKVMVYRGSANVRQPMP